ncbi:hypothetical protein AVEN_49539-1 [Araneus ventricosus]|uniref:Uncharacterized protein n=1 Tax=Araneus ventricosus TaxID=182803 RepID=A0A4Y2PPT4_ARAVE|nr:hypothetical protein AVEN_49539-1 [Araneus ventricosus]
MLISPNLLNGPPDLRSHGDLSHHLFSLGPSLGLEIVTVARLPVKYIAQSIKTQKQSNSETNLHKTEFYTIDRPLPEENFYKGPPKIPSSLPSKVQNGNIYGTAIISGTNDQIKFIF